MSLDNNMGTFQNPSHLLNTVCMNFKLLVVRFVSYKQVLPLNPALSSSICGKTQMNEL